MATTAALRHQTNRENLPRKSYPRPPVVEALTEIVVEPNTGASPSALREVMAGEEPRYPTVQELKSSNITLDVGTGVATGRSEEQHEGFRFVGANKEQVAQVQLRSLTVSKLQPYPGWESLRDETVRLWERYVAIARPARIKKLGLRYINRIDIPLAKANLAVFFQLYPVLAGNLGSQVTDFLVRLDTLPADTDGVRLRITQGRQLNPDPHLISIVLDIDIAKPDVSIEPSDHGKVLQQLEELHNLENETFESCITEHARALFR